MRSLRQRRELEKVTPATELDGTLGERIVNPRRAKGGQGGFIVGFADDFVAAGTNPTDDLENADFVEATALEIAPALRSVAARTELAPAVPSHGAQGSGGEASPQVQGPGEGGALDARAQSRHAVTTGDDLHRVDGHGKEACAAAEAKMIQGHPEIAQSSDLRVELCFHVGRQDGVLGPLQEHLLSLRSQVPVGAQQRRHPLRPGDGRASVERQEHADTKPGRCGERVADRFRIRRIPQHRRAGDDALAMRRKHAAVARLGLTEAVGVDDEANARNSGIAV